MPSTTKIFGKGAIEMHARTHSQMIGSYMRLIREFPLRRIKTAGDHARAARLAVRLSVCESDRGTAEYLDVLVDLISDYERRAGQLVDTSNLSAAGLVRHRMEERKLSASSLAALIGRQQSNLSVLLNGKRDWSKTTIRGLAVNLNINANHFLL